MKRNKQWALLAITAIFALAFIGCGGDDNTEHPKDQSRQITFGDGLFTTVTGHMTDTQWTAVTAKLTTALDGVATSDPNRSVALFGEGIINIELVETSDFDYYKIDVQALKFLFNSNFVIGATADELLEKVTDCIRAASGVPEYPLQQ